jgi:O-antigen biosynthesis protein
VSERDELERLREEVARLNDALEAERKHAAQWREVAEERRVNLEKIRQNPIVRLLFWVAGAVRPPVRRVLSRVRKVVRWARSLAAGALGLPHRLSAGSRERSLRRAVDALEEPAPDDRSVVLAILTRDGRDNLERLLPALRGRTLHERYEIVVLDNGSGEATREFLAAQDDVRVIRSETNLSFSAANNRVAEETASDAICFLNDDVEPLSRGWLRRMLAALDGGEGGQVGEGPPVGAGGSTSPARGGPVVAVGAQLVYPRRPLLARTRTRDVGVQHRGIELRPVPGGVPEATNTGEGTEPDLDGGHVDVAAVTAACLLVDRGAFQAVGGFDDRYVYGAEDVDLCWELRRRGGRIQVVPQAVLFHHEGATRHREDPADVRNRRQRRNWERLAGKLGPQLARAVTVDRLRSDLVLTSRPYEVAITVTRDLEEAGYGDWYTAQELRGAMERLGWNVRFIEKYRDAWYDLAPEVDAVVVLLDTFDVRQVARSGLTTLAWVRNWTERWIQTPWFDDFDVVLVSGSRSAEVIRERSRQRPVHFPLATNPERFAAEGPALDGDGGGGRVAGTQRERVVFTGNYWGRDTRVDDLVEAVPSLEIFGKNWDEVPQVADHWRGHLDYDDLPALYRGSLIVVDQAAQHTEGTGSVNSRVFDALAAGALPVTDQVDGARELFGDRLPTYERPEELGALVESFQQDPERARARAEELRELVLEEHTYDARARQLRDLLIERALAPSFVLKTSVPDRQVAETWGDWHLAEALARELRVRGHPVRMQVVEEWDARWGRAQDVAIHLKGRSRAERVDGQVHVIWNISHPEELTPEECDDADLVCVASRTFPEELRLRTDTPVEVLLQATDPHRFRPLPTDPAHAHDVAFVGNSRYVTRPVVRDAVAAGLRPAVYGGNWERFVDPDLIVTDHVANEELARVYSSVKVLLNDHWEGMRRHGFVSNRIFDALACAATIVSDEHEELEALFGGSVATYRRPDDLRTTLDALLADADRRREMGATGRDQVLGQHTFAHRAERLLELVNPLVEERRAAGRRSRQAEGAAYGPPGGTPDGDADQSPRGPRGGRDRAGA